MARPPQQLKMQCRLPQTIYLYVVADSKSNLNRIQKAMGALDEEGDAGLSQCQRRQRPRKLLQNGSGACMWRKQWQWFLSYTTTISYHFCMSQDISTVKPRFHTANKIRE